MPLHDVEVRFDRCQYLKWWADAVGLFCNRPELCVHQIERFAGDTIEFAKVSNGEEAGS